MVDLLSRLQTAVGDTYAIERELGGGGMSRVFLAEETRLERKVVIKLLPPEMGAGVNVERFEREIKLAAKLQHPHIVPLLTAGSEGDLLWYVMPYIEGESLRAKLAREGELPIGDTVRILKEVLDALQHAHSHRVVHRDIKPDNVLLSGNHAVVTDFGVAKAVSASTGESSLTSLGVALGTPAYMSPEQAAADPHVDHRADIYAIGAMAYEMLTGRPPFTGTNAQQVLAAHMTNEPDPVTTHRGTVPPALNEVILRCLHKKPADRFQRADEIVPHLDAILTPSGGMTPTGTQPVQAIDYEARIKQAHPVRVASLFGLASVGALAIVYVMMNVIGLPDWVLYGAIGLLIVGLPIMLLTGKRERQQAIATMTGVRMPTPTGMQRHLTWRKSTIGGALAFVGLAIVVAGYMAMRVIGIGPVGTLVARGVLEANERVIISDFANATDDSTLSETVTELLRIDLGQSPIIIVMSRGQVSDALKRMERDPDAIVTSELAEEIAVREGLKAYIDGEIRSVGQEFVVSGRLTAVGTGDELVTARETASDAGEIIDAVDRLSLRFRERIGESLRTVRADPPLANVTTGSLEALRLYAQAQRLSNQGDGQRAIALLEEAVARDTMFAMAYRSLGTFQTNPQFRRQMGLSGDSALRRAYTLRNRVSQVERYLIEAIYWFRAENDLEKAATAYVALLENYPTNGTALNNVAVVYSVMGRFAERDEMYLRAIAAGTAPNFSYTNLMGSLRDRGQHGRADSILALFAERFPESPEVPLQASNLAAARMNWVESARIAEEARTTQPEIEVWANFRLGSLAWLQGEIARANRFWEEAIRVVAQQQSVASDDRDFRIELSLLRTQVWFAENPSDYVDDIERLWLQNLGFTADLPPQGRRYLRFGDLFVRAGRPDRAQQLHNEFIAVLPESDRERLFWRITLRRDQGDIMIADGRAFDAAELFKAVRRDRLQCTLCELADIGHAYDVAGNTDSALAYFTTYLETEGDRLDDDQEWLAAILRRSGELHEAQGEDGKAVEYYSRFVELWENADPLLQEQVNDVRGRIARLVGENR